MSWDLGRFFNTLTYYDALPFAEAWRWVQNGFQPTMSVNFVPPLLAGSRPARVLLWGEGLPAGLPEALEKQGVQVSQDLTSATVILGLADAQVAKAHLQALRATAQTEHLLFDFRQPNPNLNEFWGILDDVVMGGVSQSQLLWGERQLLFTGQVSTANSGGFVSTRTRNMQPPLDLSGFAGLELRLRGDGQRYKFFLRDQTGWDSPAYSYAFETSPEEEQTVRIPFAEMVPTFRARIVPAAPALNTRQICSLQLMLSKFEADGSLNPQFRPGPFQLGLRWIGAYRRDPWPQLIGVARGPIAEDLLAEVQASSSRWCVVEVAPDAADPIPQLIRVLGSPQAVGRVERVEHAHA
ncbi:MAG: CIA30 family protein [Thermostichus sp. BF3_bins_97]